MSNQEEERAQWAPLGDGEEEVPRANRRNRLMTFSLLVGLFGFVAIGVNYFDFGSSPSITGEVRMIQHPQTPQPRTTLEIALPLSEFVRATSISTFNRLLMSHFVPDAKAAYNAMSHDQLQLLFQDFVTKIGTQAPETEGVLPEKKYEYSSDAEHQLRLEIFKKNILDIITQNQETHKSNPSQNRARFGVTIHADWTVDEFTNIRFNSKSITPEHIKTIREEMGSRQSRTTMKNATNFKDSLGGRRMQECSIATGGTCAIFPCHAYRAATCYEKQCVCTNGACNEGGKCVRQGDCKIATGGSCHFFGCNSWRNAECVAGACVCPVGTCAEKGQCVESAPLVPSKVKCSTSYEGPVRNQGRCGDCWAFATAQQLRYMAFAKTGRDVGTLSVQSLVDCDTEYADKKCGEEGVKGCCGGLPYYADRWLAKNGGIPTQEDYGPLLSDTHPTTPYTCKKNVKKTVLPSKSVNVFDTETEIANQLCKQGPVAVAIAANKALMHYRGGVFTSADCPANQINHAVLYTGVDKTFHRDEMVHVILNSWGPSWGVEASQPYKPFSEGGGGGHVLFKFGENVCNLVALATAPEDVTIL